LDQAVVGASLRDKERRQTQLLLCLAAGVFVCLLLWHLGQRELWTDEAFSLGVALGNPEHAVSDASHPPGYYLLLRAWMRAGHSDFWLRGFSIPWALLVWWLGWLIAGELNLRREGRLAAVLMAVSPLLLLYFRLGRYYSLAATASCCCILFILRTVRQPKPRRVVGLAVILAATAYVDYVALAVCLAALLLASAHALVRREWRGLRGLAIAGAVGLAGALPVFVRLAHDVSRVGGIEANPLAHSAWGLLVKLGLPVYALATGECIDPWRWLVVVPIVLVVLGLLITGLVMLLRAGGSLAVAACIWPINLAVAVAAMSTAAANLPANRITSLAMTTIPLAYLLMARGLTSLPRPGYRFVAMAALVGVYVYGLNNYFAGAQLLNPGYAPPWRQAAEIVVAREQPGDALATWESSFPRYYHGRARIWDWYYIPTLLRSTPLPCKRVWLVTRDRGSDAVQGQVEDFRCNMRERGLREQVFLIQPRSAEEIYWRSLFLRRPAWNAHVKVYLYSPA
jgi:uncharacterized membrane protein